MKFYICLVAFFLSAKTTIAQTPNKYVELVPACFTTSGQEILVQEEREKIVYFEPKYKAIKEKVLVHPPYKKWTKKETNKRGCFGGWAKIWTQVDVPIQFKTITSKVIAAPAAYQTMVQPAVYKYIQFAKATSTPKIIVKEEK